MDKVKAWLSQGSTIAGFAALFSALSGALSHQITWDQFAVVVAGAVVGIIWPQRPGVVAPAKTLVTDLESLVQAYRLGVQHGSDAAVKAAPAVDVYGKPINQ